MRCIKPDKQKILKTAKALPKRLLSLLKAHFFPIILIIISLTVCLINYSPNTFQTGWDTLHPEFNFGLNLQRDIFSAWQEYQGLGAPAAQSHAGELPRIIILQIFSLVLPLNALRYAYMFLMLIIGPLGIYFFTRYLIRKKFPEQASTAAFLAAVFYLLNLGTIQQFFVQQELFTTLYGYIGFLFLFVTKFLREKDKKNLLIFAVLTFLSTPMADTATLFFGYFICLVGYLFFSVLVSQERLKATAKVLILIVVVIAVNSFWLINAVQYAVTYSTSLENSRFDRFLSGIALEENEKSGSVDNVFSLKGFELDWQISEQGKTVYVMQSWRDHLDQNGVEVLIGIVLVIMLFGTAYGSFKSSREVIPLLGVLAMSGFFLINYNNPTGVLYKSLITFIPQVEGILRFPYTKFSIQFIFAYTCMFAFGCLFLLKALYWIHLRGFAAKITIIFGVMTIIFVICLPVFYGNLLSKLVRVDIPSYYFQLFDYLNQQDTQGRIAPLPINNYAGWPEYEWGYQGSGFIWFGEKQPILDRDFDRWYSRNEDYFEEMQKAIYSRNVDAFDKVINKYKIAYVLVDQSIFSTDPKALDIDGTKELLKNSSVINQANTKTFGDILLYETTYAQEKYPEFSNTSTQDEQTVFDLSRTAREQDRVTYDLTSQGLVLTRNFSNPITDLNLNIKDTNENDYYTWNFTATSLGNSIGIEAELQSPQIIVNKQNIPLVTASYHKQININPNKTYTVVINGNQKFTYDPNGPNSWEALLGSNEQQTISFFDPTAVTELFGPNLKTVNILSCQPNNENPIDNKLSISRDNTIVADTRKQQQCITLISSSTTKPQLVELTYTSKSGESLGLDDCIRQNGDCLNRPLFTDPDIISKTKDIDTWAYLTANQPLTTTLIINSNLSSTPITFANIHILSYDQVGQLTASPIITQDLIRTKVTNSSSISIVLPYPASLSSELQKFPAPTLLQKTGSDPAYTNDSINFDTKDANDVASWNIMNFPSEMAFLLAIDGDYKGGQTPGIYVGNNQINTNIIVDKLYEDYSRNIFLKPPTFSNDIPGQVSAKDLLTISLVNGSYSPDIASINNINQVKIIPIPYYLFKNITLTNRDTTPAKQIEYVAENPVFDYVAASNTGNSINFYMANNTNWIFVCTDNLQITHSFNSPDVWYNKFNTSCTHGIMVYIPQLEQLGGYGLLIGSLVGIFFYTYPNKRRQLFRIINKGKKSTAKGITKSIKFIKSKVSALSDLRSS